MSESLLTLLVKACASGDAQTVRDLLEEGAPVNRDFRISASPLYAAACNGHLKCVQLILSYGGSDLKIDDGDNSGRTPLYAACVNKHFDCAKLIAAKGANIATGGGPDGGGPIHAAARHNATKFLNFIFGIITPNDRKLIQSIKDKSGRIALHSAVSKNAVDAAEYLVANGSDVNASDARGITPLHVVCMRNAVDCLDVLVESRRLQPMIKDTKGRSALHFAAATGSKEVLEVLITEPPTKQHVILDAQDSSGMTAAHYAAMNNNMKCLSLLVANGASLDIVDDDGRNVVHCAALLKSTFVLSVLIERYKLQVNVMDEDGRTPLMLASANNMKKSVKWLLDNGANVSIKDKTYGRTSLHWAARLGRTEALKILIEHDTSIDARDNFGRTPLHLAALGGSDECVELLIDKNAKIDIPDKKGMTPIYLAASRGFTKCIKYLLGAGADYTIRSAKSKSLPIHAASLGGHESAVNLLSRLIYSERDFVNGNMHTPIHCAAAGGDDKCLDTLLIQKIGTAEDRDSEGLTPLHIAAFKGNVECLQSLLEVAPSLVDTVDNRGETPLFKAIASGSAECIEALVDAGANLAVKDNNGRTVAHAAASLGDSSILEYIIDKLGPECLEITDQYGCLPIHYVIEPEDEDSYELLLSDYWEDNPMREKFVPFSDRHSGTDGSTVFHIAGSNGDSDLADLLLEIGADINVPDKNGVTPLMTAIAQGKIDFVGWATDQDPRCALARDSKGRTPLHYAAFHKVQECVEMIIDCGVNVDCRDFDGNSPLFYAAASGHLQTFNKLIENGASPRMPNKKKYTPLHFASINGHLNIIERLFELKCPVNSKGIDGRTPLHVAAHNGKHHICQILVQLGAKIDAVDRLGRTSLFYAAVNNDALTISKLMNMGAEIGIVDTSGKRASDYAREKGFIHCAELLEGKSRNFSFTEKVKAKYAFNARDTTEISLKPGDIVNVLWMHKSGWWKGELNGKVGMFPGNYCVKI